MHAGVTSTTAAEPFELAQENEASHSDPDHTTGIIAAPDVLKSLSYSTALSQDVMAAAIPAANDSSTHAQLMDQRLVKEHGRARCQPTVSAPSSHGQGWSYADAVSYGQRREPPGLASSHLSYNELMPYGTVNSSSFINDPLSGSWQADVPTASDERTAEWPTWTMDPSSDFVLFNDSMNRYLNQEENYIAPGSLVVDTSTSVAASRLLLSPFNSIDGSSTTSNDHRKKKEIMEGAQGEFKCQHCGASFRTSDDCRHHEYRVHLPYAARPLSCSQCGRRFIFRKDLNRHLTTHEDRASHAKFFCHYVGCKFAVHGFARKDHYNRHVATHHKADSGI